MNKGLLQKKGGIPISKLKYSLWSEWNAHNYLETYFSNPLSDTKANLQFLVRELKEFKGRSKQKILDFGSGPTIFSAIAASPYASEIHITDYLVDNLMEVQKWLSESPDAFDWRPCTKEILKLEGGTPSQKNIEERNEALRRIPTRVMLCDASLPLPIKTEDKYPIVITNFCADSATASKEICKVYMKNISGLVDKGGTLLLSALRNCSFYKIGNKLFPCANLNEGDLLTILLESGFALNKIKIEVHDVPDCAQEGFTSIMFARAQRSVE